MGEVVGITTIAEEEAVGHADSEANAAAEPSAAEPSKEGRVMERKCCSSYAFVRSFVSSGPLSDDAFPKGKER
jgi:hypothetical protein